MIIFMSGYPQSGKSKFVEALLKQIELDDGATFNTTVIDAKNLLPEDFDSLSDDEQKSWQISSWEVCLEQTINEIDEREVTDLIILDTSAAQIDVMRPLFTRARKRDHNVGYVFVHSDLEERQSRTKNDLSKFQKYYSECFKKAVPHLKKLSDYSFVIRNHNDDEFVSLKEAAKTVTRMIKAVKENTGK